MRSALHKLLLAGFVSLCCANSQAADAGSSFLGVMGGSMRYQEDSLDNNLELPALAGRAGYDFNHWFGVEGRAGAAFENQTEVCGVDVESRIPHFISALARVGWRSTNVGVGAYGLAGYSQAKVEAEAHALGTTFRTDETAEDFSYGGGVEVFFSERNGMNVEYIRYLDKSESKLEHIGIGYVRRF